MNTSGPVEGDPVEQEVAFEVERALPAAFSVRDAATAAWVVRRVVAARQYAGRVAEWAELERRRAAAEERRLMWLFGQQLRFWAAAEIEQIRGRRKSIALPGGTVGFRNVPSRLLVQDEAALLAWARVACPAAVVVNERLVKTPVNEHFEQTGEVPPGAIVTPAETTFYIR